MWCVERNKFSFFQKYIEIYNFKNIKVYGYDTFEGIPMPTNQDVDKYGNSMKLKMNKN